MNITVEDIKKLREETEAGVMACRSALEDCRGNFEKAKGMLREQGIAKAEKKAEREVKSGLVEAYVHGDGRVGVLLELNCETDFVARNENFKKLAHELALQIASMSPKDPADLLIQAYIRDPKITVSDMIKEVIAKTGENIQVGRFSRFAVGE